MLPAPSHLQTAGTIIRGVLLLTFILKRSKVEISPAVVLTLCPPHPWRGCGQYMEGEGDLRITVGLGGGAQHWQETLALQHQPQPIIPADQNKEGHGYGYICGAHMK